jgi:hypothetical protein
MNKALANDIDKYTLLHNNAVPGHAKPTATAAIQDIVRVVPPGGLPINIEYFQKVHRPIRLSGEGPPSKTMEREEENALAIGGMRRPHLSIGPNHSPECKQARRLRTVIIKHIKVNHAVLDFALATLEGQEAKAPEHDPELIRKYQKN